MAVTIKENWKNAEHLELLHNTVEFLSDIVFLIESFAKQCLEKISKKNTNLLYKLNNINIFVQKIKTMIRQEFSAQLAAIRKSTDIKIKDLCYALNVLQDAIYRLEAGRFNYDTNRMLAYCQCVGIELEIHYADTDVIIDNYDTLLNTIIDVRKSAGHTQHSIASAIGMTQHAIAFMEIQKSALTIDVMLKICDTCGAVITIKRKEDEACGLES